MLTTHWTTFGTEVNQESVWMSVCSHLARKNVFGLQTYLFIYYLPFLPCNIIIRAYVHLKGDARSMWRAHSSVIVTFF